MRERLLLVVTAVLLTACSAQVDSIQIQAAWVRPAETGMNTAAYFIIENSGEDDRLMDADSHLAASTEIHRSYLDENEVMRMEKQASVAIPGGGSVTFEPGGLHVMLIDLGQDLILGDEIRLSLFFEKQGELTIHVPVQTH